MTVTTRRMRVVAITAAVLSAAFVPTSRAAEGPGDQRRWTLDFRARLERSAGEQPLDVDVTGEWVSTIVAVRSVDYDAALQLANVHVKGSVAAGSADAVEEATRRLTRPFWGTYRSDGALVRVHFLKDVAPSDRNLLQMIATETEFVRPDSARPVWTALERDSAGTYMAIYQLASTNAFVKRKLKYVDTDGVVGAPANRFQVAVDQSELRFALDPNGGIASVDGTERIRIGMAFGGGAQLASVIETHLGAVRTGHAPELIGSLTRALPELVSSPVVTQSIDPQQALAARDARLLEGHSTESLLNAAMSGGTDSVLREQLEALFRRRPEASAAAVARIEKNGPSKQIINALGTAGSPAAIRALGTLARHRQTPGSTRVDALSALLRSQHPAPEAMRLASDLLDDGDSRVQSAARLVSGGLARAGRSEHRAEADQIDAALVTRYRNAATVQDRCDVIAALGNSIGPEPLELIKEALRDPREPVRAAAARALRLAPGADIDALLSSAIASDPEAAVRSNAILAARFRHPLASQIGEALVRVAKTDPVDSIRTSAISLLRQNPGVSANTVETLAWIADNDGNPGIRRLAREAIASMSGGSR